MNPTEHLVNISRSFPNAWVLAHDIRQARGTDLPGWPVWCFMPMAGWYSIVSNAVGKDRLDLSTIKDVAKLAALGAWRYTQGIYRYHPALYAALKDTDPSGILPVDVILRLPEWCVYIETPGSVFYEMSLHGFFAYLEFDVGQKHSELRIILSHDNGTLVTAPPIHLGAWTVEKAIEISIDEAKDNNPEYAPLLSTEYAGEMAKNLMPLLSLLLYICADEPEITGHVPGVYPSHPDPVKTKKGLRLFPPEKPRVWKIGEDIGEKLERGRQDAESHGVERSSPRPHIRRAHWHGFWSGPRKERPEVKKQERIFRYQWLPPIIVAGDE